VVSTLNIDGGIILTNINMYLEKRVSLVDWIQRDQGRDQWRELISTIMNLRSQ